MKQIVANLSKNTIEVDYKKRNNQQFNMDVAHYHPSFEIYYLLEGERIYFIKDQSYTIYKGDFVFIPPNTLHKTLATSTFAHERLLLSFDVTYLECFTHQMTEINWYNIFDIQNPVLSIPLVDRGTFHELLFKIYAQYEKDDSESYYYVQILILELLLLLNKYKSKAQEPRKANTSPMHLKIFEIVRYINDHYADNITLTHLAQRYFISPYYLSHVFKEVTGFTFSNYLTQLRILEAKKLLSSTKFSMTRIAELVGYESSTHFGRAFKKVTLMTPLAYRNAQA